MRVASQISLSGVFQLRLPQCTRALAEPEIVSTHTDARIQLELPLCLSFRTVESHPMTVSSPSTLTSQVTACASEGFMGEGPPS